MKKKIKIAIVAANNIRVSPYIFFYVNIFEKYDWEVTLFYPNRLKIQESVSGVNIHTYEAWDSHKSNFINYYNYSTWVRAKLYKNPVDGLVSLTMLNSIFLMSSLTMRRYINKYIVDIRDFSYEKYFTYRLFEKRVLKKSLLNVISSSKFKSFLPQEEYLVCHNISVNINKKYEFQKSTAKKILISYIGAVSYKEQCRKLINLVNADERFLFHIHGQGNDSDYLDNLIMKNNNPRIKSFGGYLPSEKDELINQADIIFNAYGNDSPRLTCALSNKLYDSLYHVKPMLNSPNTYMNELAGMLSYSIDLDKEDNLDGLYSWYMGLDKTSLENYADKTLKEMIKENQNTERAIIQGILRISV